MNDILNWDDKRKFWDYLYKESLFRNEFAHETITTLRSMIFEEELINFYLERSQNIDLVLEIFIRTNSGGQPLSFSNLLMSYTTANWSVLDARKTFADLIRQVYSIGLPNFVINADLILKTYLVLFKDNIKFQVKNFDKNGVAQFERDWDAISKAVVAAFELIDSWGFNDSNFRAKNAIIPVVYFIYHNKLQDTINNPAKLEDVKKSIRKWLCLSLLKGVFGGQSDNVLNKIRNVLKAHKGDCTFPVKEIKEAFRDDPSKNLSFTNELVDDLLSTQKEQANCYIILALLYSHLTFDKSSRFHMDHLHPYSYFDKLRQGNMSEDDYKFYKDPQNYNSVLNLQLLNGSLNESKSDQPLAEWVKENDVDLDNQLIPKNVSLDVSDFMAFIEARRNLLRQRLLLIAGI